ncbi:MAG: putative D-ribose transporter ATP-binding protein [Microbacteriaceae bacterium]|nr:putative D-ribose transporter ATP-binding protein [Microbacteriaceae bacterium]
MASIVCSDIVKGFGGIPVLKGISITFEPGTVTVLVGENGAGKSTLIKIIAGLETADHGEVMLDAEPLVKGDPRAANLKGIRLVPQELAPIPDMTVYENLFIGRELKTRAGLLDRKRMIREAKELLHSFDVDIDPLTPARQLSVAMLQLVEIINATSQGATALLLDEPTSAIPDREIEGLYKIVRRVRAMGAAVVYTTHKMEEIAEISDRVVVLRDGNLVSDLPTSETTHDGIISAMIGRDLDDLFSHTTEPDVEEMLTISGLTLHGGYPLDLSVKRGEIVGLAGLVGAGRTEFLEGVFGVRPTVSGTIEVKGKYVRRNDPAAAIRSRIALVPEDRKGAGTVLSMSILDNATLPHLASFSTAGWMRNVFRAKSISAVMKSVRLKSRGLGQSLETLSGGNQQKVVFARWLTEDIDVLLLDEPTRGVDIGARSEIYRIIADLAASGVSVVMASSDMPEILGLAHRAIVVRNGQFVGELNAEQLRREDAQDSIFRLAAGIGLVTAATGLPAARV